MALPKQSAAKGKTLPVAYMLTPVILTETETGILPSGKMVVETFKKPATKGHTFQVNKEKWNERRGEFTPHMIACGVTLPCRTDKCEAQRKGVTNKQLMRAIDDMVESGSQLIAFKGIRGGRKPLAMWVAPLYQADIEAMDANATPEAQEAAHARSAEVERKQDELREMAEVSPEGGELVEEDIAG